MSTLTFAAIFIALFVSHHVSDHLVQTHVQACTKGGDGWAARIACAKHVAGHMLTSIVCLAALNLVHVHVQPGPAAVGLAVIAVTHYWADRRTTLAWLARITAHAGFWVLGAPRSVGVFVHDPADPMGRHLIRAKVYEVDDDGHLLLDANDQPTEVPLDNPSLGTGAYAMDQSWHIAWLFVAALVMAVTA